MRITIGLVDDHQLFLKSLVMMLQSFNKYDVTVEALNGKDLQVKLAVLDEVPDIMLIDVNMPVMNGIDTAIWLSEKYPAMKLIALSMNDKDITIISMFKAGCCAYLLKDTNPSELEKALDEVYKHGFYNADSSNVNFRRLLAKMDDSNNIKMTAKELQFLQYACSELTYKEVAVLMKLSERTIDGYRESLFQKFNVQSRVGLCMEALRRELVKL